MYFSVKRSFSILFLVASMTIIIGVIRHVQSTVAAASNIKDNQTNPILDAPKAESEKIYSKLPLSFEANYGQTDRNVKFFTRSSGYNIYLTPDEAVVTLHKSASEKLKSDSKVKPKTSDSILRMKFAGANEAPQMTGTDELPGKNNYLVGNDPGKWRTNVPTYGKVKYESVYPGIDAIFYGNQRQLEYDFVVAPGADPNNIKLSFQGAKTLKISQNGDLVIKTRSGEIRQSKPIIYQEVNGSRRNVSGGYSLEGKTRVAFSIGDYDRSQPLVIDPVLLYSTFLGGSIDDAVQDIAVDAAGNAYLTGYTTSINFPTATPTDPTYNGGQDVFVTKLDTTGTTALYSTYLGGANEDGGYGIGLDSFGNAYITGITRSPNFPITPGAADSTCQSTTGPGGLCAPFPHAGDAFVTKLNSSGAIDYSTFVGGLDYEQAYAIAVDSVGNAYITGGIANGNATCTFPAVNAYDNCANSYYDTFITKVNPTGTSFLYSTTFGGNNDEYAGSDIAVDNTGNAYMSGVSRSINLPTTPGAFDSVCGTSFSQHVGIFDAFAVKINTNAVGAASLAYSTCIGGGGDDNAGGIGVDGTGNIWLTGGTSSNDFPIVNAFDASTNGGGDAFLVKLNPFVSGTNQLVYASYLGGSAGDGGSDVAVDGAGNVYVVGGTTSPNFPTADPLQLHQGNSDAFVTKLNPLAAGSSQLLFSTYLGACGNDSARRVAVDAVNDVFLVGSTNSPAFPTTANAYQNALSGNGDGFVAKISAGGPTIPVLGCGSSDSDGDGFANSADNCPNTPNPDQADTDGDGIGNVCDPTPNGDTDGDGIDNSADNCPNVPNPTQIDTDNDGIGDACDFNAPPPTLSGEVAAYPPPPGSLVVTPTGPACTSYSFAVTTTASGPYQGTFTATGTFTLEPMTPDPMTPNINYRVVSWTETFTINQPVSVLPPQPIAHVITGTKQINSSANGSGINVAQCSATIVNPSPIATTYQATITGADGTFTDSGSAQSGIIYMPSNPSAASFFENFSSNQVTTTPANDSDGDGVANTVDNCPTVANTDQADSDGDGIGNACDPDPNDGPTGDADGDGAPNNADNCLSTSNPDQLDTDSDGQGNVCDTDDDNDGVADGADNCQLTANTNQFNTDGDAFGDACDSDDDNDGVMDGADNCPLTHNPDQSDADSDGIGNVCDTDDDNDGVADSSDNCPLTANPDQSNFDNDSMGDVCDPDDDNDGVADAADFCPNTPSNTPVNSSGCPDADGDTIADSSDNCPATPNTNQANNDNDALGDACDPDDDNDGVSDSDETTAGSDPLNPASKPEVCDGADNDLDNLTDEGFANTDGDNQADCIDADDDNDGASDADETIAGSDPLNSASTPEICDGIDNDLNEGVDEGFVNTDGDSQADCVDVDDDNDGVSDTNETAAGSDPLNANSKPEVCDGVDNDLNEGVDEGFANTDGDSQADCVDTDDDNDGQTDADEQACGSNPLDANSKSTDTDNDAKPNCVDLDDDNDGVLDATDNCQLVVNPNQANADGDAQGDVCDPDDDNDGVLDGSDLCPGTPANTAVNASGCPDADGDGVIDTADNCPFVANPDQRDTDGNGVGDVCTPFQLPIGGQFVIGDLVNQSPGATVNFWGAQWSQNNPMSGGSAPNSFKGFENGNALPTCGSTWTSQPGNSSNPPATIPEYMAVIVSSSVKKNGSVITGNVRRIIIVKTNPGYGPSPGQRGTGQVVAILCSAP